MSPTAPKRWRRTLMNPVITLVVAVVTIAIAQAVVGDRWVNEPVHATLETAVGVLALLCAVLLLWGQPLHDVRYLGWVAAGMVVQGILDITHALTSFGPPFYWSRTLSTVLGAPLFALAWVPLPIRSRGALLGAVTVTAIVIGVLLLATPELWPSAFDAGGRYESWAQRINQVSGVAYFIGAVFFLRAHHRGGAFSDAVFASYAVLMGLAGVLFGFSTVWDGPWWGFHALRLVAAVVSVGYIASFLRDLAQRRRTADVTAKEQASAIAADLSKTLEATYADLERERKTLRAVIMQAPLPMALYEGPELRVALANDAYIATVGGREIRGRPLIEAVPELRDRPTFGVIREALDTGEPRRLEEYLAPLRDPDGTVRERYFTAAYQPMRDERDQVTGVIVIGMEVTDLVRARQVVDQFARRMSVLVEASRALAEAGLALDVVVQTVVRQVVTHRFDSAALHLRAEGSDRLELAALAHADPEPQAAMQVMFAAPLTVGEGVAGRVAATGEHFLRTKVDPADLRAVPELIEFFERYPIHGFVIVPIRARAEILGILSVTRFSPEPRLDEEDARLLQELADRAALAIVAARQHADLLRARSTVQQSLRFAEEFIGMLGHDLRNPLNAVQVAAALLVAQSETGAAEAAAVRKLGERILRSSRRMTDMVSQLLDLTRTRVGTGIPLQLEDGVDVAKLVPSIIEEVQLAHPPRTVHIESTGDTSGRWDAQRLSQVLSNLIGNAFEHGDRRAPIDVALTGSSDEVRISVHNAGPPIPAEMLPVLFDPYHRVDARSHHSQGLGLGLYISQQIATAHGGRIEVSSSAPGGTTFVVFLPRSGPEVAAV